MNDLLEKEIARLAEKLNLFSAGVLTKSDARAALSELAEFVIKQAAERVIDELVTCEITTDWEVGYNTGIRHSQAAILAMTDRHESRGE
jgi:hypothetical protein